MSVSCNSFRAVQCNKERDVAVVKIEKEKKNYKNKSLLTKLYDCKLKINLLFSSMYFLY